MTHADYIKKKKAMFKLAIKPNKTDSERQQMNDLAADVGLYEANNGMVDENEFYNNAITQEP